MQLWTTVIHAMQLLTALTMIGLVLIQHGKGADMGASFGSGASGSLFGASGSANFLSRSTAACAAVFFACTLALAFIGNDRSGAASSLTSGGSVLDRAAPAASAPAALPAIPGAAPAASAAHGRACGHPCASGAGPGGCAVRAGRQRGQVAFDRLAGARRQGLAALRETASFAARILRLKRVSTPRVTR